MWVCNFICVQCAHPPSYDDIPIAPCSFPQGLLKFPLPNPMCGLLDKLTAHEATLKLGSRKESAGSWAEVLGSEFAPQVSA